MVVGRMNSRHNKNRDSTAPDSSTFDCAVDCRPCRNPLNTDSNRPMMTSLRFPKLKTILDQEFTKVIHKKPLTTAVRNTRSLFDNRTGAETLSSWIANLAIASTKLIQCKATALRPSRPSRPSRPYMRYIIDISYKKTPTCIIEY
jgi:hypothetical protein